MVGDISQTDPFALSLSKGCPQGAPWLRQAQPERLRKICLRHVPIESASLNLKCPFGLSLSKPCAALRQAQRERFKQIRAVSIIRQKRLKSLRRRCETALRPPRDLRPGSSATASAHGNVRRGRQTRAQSAGSTPSGTGSLPPATHRASPETANAPEGPRCAGSGALRSQSGA